MFLIVHHICLPVVRPAAAVCALARRGRALSVIAVGSGELVDWTLEFFTPRTMRPSVGVSVGLPSGGAGGCSVPAYAVFSISSFYHVVAGVVRASGRLQLRRHLVARQHLVAPGTPRRDEFRV